jgi:hypothetical protein
MAILAGLTLESDFIASPPTGQTAASQLSNSQVSGQRGGIDTMHYRIRYRPFVFTTF